MKSFFLCLQNALNSYMALDPESKKRIRALQGKIVNLELLGLNLTFQLVFSADKIQVMQDDTLKADTYIKGTPLSLIHMKFSPDRKQFFTDDMIIEGDLELGQTVLALFDELEIDWEEYLSKIVGDVPAHHVGRLIFNVKNFGKRVYGTLLQNVNEYSHEEIEIFPPKEELYDFFADVDEIRMDVDRMQARIELLKRSMM